MSRTPNGILIGYTLEGDIDQLRLPAARTPRFVDGLWRHTCFEAFVARSDSPAYTEFNFSPSGEWATYLFERPRVRVPGDTGLDRADANPHITVCRAPGKLDLDAVVRLDRLPSEYADARLVLGLSAVIEDSAGALSYWALKHPADQPDFHRREAFVLEIDEIRN